MRATTRGCEWMQNGSVSTPHAESERKCLDASRRTGVRRHLPENGSLPQNGSASTQIQARGCNRCWEEVGFRHARARISELHGSQ